MLIHQWANKGIPDPPGKSIFLSFLFLSFSKTETSVEAIQYLHMKRVYCHLHPQVRCYSATGFVFVVVCLCDQRELPGVSNWCSLYRTPVHACSQPKEKWGNLSLAFIFNVSFLHLYPPPSNPTTPQSLGWETIVLIKNGANDQSHHANAACDMPTNISRSREILFGEYK